MSARTKWHCWRCGLCCRSVAEIVMTPEELGAVTAAAPSVEIRWEPAEPGFVKVLAAPCPYLEVTRCLVYAARPYNCRRWMCGRARLTDPVDLAAVPVSVLSDRDLRRQYAVNQRKAQPWADAHGWTPPEAA